MKVLILHPDLKDPGGVTGYFRQVKNKFTIPAQYFIVGTRQNEQGLIQKFLRLIRDYKEFINFITQEKISIIHLNPSLDLKSLIRDSIFILLSRLYKVKTITFIHGWQKKVEKLIEKYGLWIYKSIFETNKAIIVLAKDFKKKHEVWGFRNRIYQETTIADDEIIKYFDIEGAIKARAESACFRILFISRIFRQKGIYETIDAFKNLHSRFTNMELIIAGDGPELKSSKAYVKSLNINKVIFTGYISGEEKYNLFKRVHVLCLPTYYGEGLPTVIVEAMTFGLPVVTSPVGGIKDFFSNGKHGFLVESKNHKEIEETIIKIYLNPELFRKISIFNYNYAKKYLMASQAAKRLEHIYREAFES